MKFLYALRREVFVLHSCYPQNFLRSPAALPPSVGSQRGRDSLLRHGQGCGPSCGCVMDIQMSVDREGTVTEASFVAKRTVLGTDGAPLTTRSGKLLISDCSCQTLRSLGSIATSECKGENLDSLRNRMLFTPAAPPAFWRTLMRNLGAPAAASACGQVAEAALTTALTDRPYINNSNSRKDRFRSLPSWHRNSGGEGAGAGATERLEDEYYADHAEREGGGEKDEDGGLAEVDFRQQYDDFA